VELAKRNNYDSCISNTPQLGAFLGEIHAVVGVAMYSKVAMDSIGCVTNGAVRNLAAVEALGSEMYASHPSMSRACGHITDFGEPAEIGGLKTSLGDSLHSDRHAGVAIPLCFASDVFREAAKIRVEEQQFVQFRRSPRLRLGPLAERFPNMNPSCDSPWRGI
jgi:regulator of RNase E activity RraA